MYFEKLRGRKSKALQDLFNDVLIIELLNGKTYGGALDEYYYNGGGVVVLYSCKILDSKKHAWIDHDIMVEGDSEVRRDSMPAFWLKNMKEIFVLLDEFRDKFNLVDALQLYIDPHFRPLSPVQCDWSVTEKHSTECDVRLHEALSVLETSGQHSGQSSTMSNGEREESINESFHYVRRRLLATGARIP